MSQAGYRPGPRLAAPPRMSLAEVLLAIGGVLWGLALILIFLQAPLYSGTSATSANSTESCASSANALTCTGNNSTDTASVVTETHTTATLTDVNGQRVLAYAIGPLLMIAIICIVLGERPVARGPGVIAWTAMGLLAAFTLLAMMSIGILIVPLTGAAVALCAVRQSRATRLTHGRGIAAPTSPSP